MLPYQAYRRGLINYATYLEQKDRDNISVSDNQTRSVILTGILNIGENETWEVRSEESALGYIGPSSNLENVGTINIDGDVLFLCVGGHLVTTGDGTTTGTLEIRDL